MAGQMPPVSINIERARAQEFDEEN